jgi:hypothetical protein
MLSKPLLTVAAITMLTATSASTAITYPIDVPLAKEHLEKLAAGENRRAALTHNEGDLFIALIDSHLEANPLCEGGPQVCRSKRFLMVSILNTSSTTYEKGTITCSVFRKKGHDLIETKTQQISGPIFPRKVNQARGQPRNAPALVDRAMSDAVAMVEFQKPFPAEMDVECAAKGEGSVAVTPPPGSPPSEDERSLRSPALTSANYLGKAYVAYIKIKRCFAARVGYVVVYINDDEMTRARRAVLAIERQFNQKQKDELWLEANRVVGKWMTEYTVDLLRFDQARETCQASLRQLMMLRALATPMDEEGPITPKDF